MTPGQPFDLMGSPSPAPLFIRRSGAGPPVVLVHGGLSADMTWACQRELETHWLLIVPSRRGFSPSPAASWQDFLADADDLAELVAEVPAGAHLVGFSYGGLGACIAAERVPHQVRSLILIEVPLWTVAEEDESVGELATLAERFAASADDAQAEREFCALAGIDRKMLARKEDDIRHAMELCRKFRSAWEAKPRFDVIIKACIPTLVVSGDHDPALERLCDAIATRLGGQRARMRGCGHAVQRTSGFNTMLETFLTAAERCRGDGGDAHER